MMTFLASLLYGLAMSPGIYLQFVPFVQQLEPEEARRIWKNVAGICFAEVLVLYFLQLSGLLPFELDTYRKLSFFFWAPTFLYAADLFHREIFFVFFILSLRTLLVIILETVNIFFLLQILSREVLAQVFPVSFVLYGLLMGILLPFARTYFCQVYGEYIRIPRRRFFRTVLPLTGTLALESTWTSWQSDIFSFSALFQSRIFLFVILFLVAETIRQALHIMTEELEGSEKNSLLESQIGHTGEYMALAQASQKRMDQLQQKRRHYLQQLLALVQKKDQPGVASLIRELGIRMDQTKLPRCCENNLVNAALTAYLTRARKEKIPARALADIPQDIGGSSGDLSIVLSNLLENAIIASEKQPQDRREIVLMGLRQGSVLNLLVKNRFDGSVEWGEDGLPVTHEKGHGLGMRSLSRFQEKYGASVLCRQEDGWFTTYLQVDTAARHGT